MNDTLLTDMSYCLVCSELHTMCQTLSHCSNATKKKKKGCHYQPLVLTLGIATVPLASQNECNLILGIFSINISEEVKQILG